MARPLQKIKNELIYFLASILIAALNFLPFRWMKPLGRWFGAVVFRFAGGERRKSLRSLKTAYPSLSEAEVQKRARAVWVRMGWNLFEVVHWMPLTHEEVANQVARVEGWENLEKAMARGKGVLALSAHLGNWELMGAYLAFKYPASGVAQKLYDPRFDDLVTWMREDKLHIAMIKRGMALRGILEALKENRVVIALVDQDTGNDGVFVPFFGKEAWTQSGVARIAQKTGAALVPVFVVRGPDGKFELHVEKEIEVPRTGDREKDVMETVRRYTQVVESYVKTYSDQWMWMHDRWKTKPKMENDRSFP